MSSLENSLQQLIDATDLPAMQAVLLQHPALLTDDALDALRERLAYLDLDETPDAEAQSVLEMRLELMELCREMGTEAAFAQLTSDQPDEGSPLVYLVELLDVFVSSLDWDQARQIVEANPDLLELEALAVLDALLSQAEERHLDTLADLYSRHRTVLRLCREFGIEEAFRRIQGGEVDSAADLARDEALAEVIAELITRPDLATARAVIEAHPELLTLRTDEALASMLRTLNAAYPGDPQINLLLAYRTLLNLCRTQGLEAAFQAVQEGLDRSGAGGNPAP